jgi:regulator of protease activity HflC (stomatin/prohibitin superfamily)
VVSEESSTEETGPLMATRNPARRLQGTPATREAIVMRKRIVERFRAAGARAWVLLRATWAAFMLGFFETLTTPKGRRVLAVLGIGAMTGLLIWKPPVRSVAPGEVGVRINRLTGGVAILLPGPAVILPGLQELRRYSLREQVYRPEDSATATAKAPFQSIEGLSLGVATTVRWAIDQQRVTEVAARLPENVGHDLIEPVVDGVLHRTISRYTVREVFTAKRREIQDGVEKELRDLLAKDGVIVRAVFLGHVDLPAEYRKGMDNLLAEELEVDKMKYTIEVKAQEVKQKTLEAEAQKAAREKAAEAAAQEEIIAAKGKAEAMKHVLPFKEKEIEQRRLEAEAQKVSRLKEAEGQAEARRIEAGAEADARKKLADADAYRLDVTGKAASEQMARDSQLIAANPLLIQKTLADKLSDKIQVIVAPPSTDGLLLSSVMARQSAALAPVPVAVVKPAPHTEEE